MRKVGIAIALLLIVVQVIFGQEKVYLPLILKSGHSMTDLAVLEISDGETTVDLINEKNGFHLVAWNPAIAGAKDGGTFQSSSLASSRRLVNRVFGNANEVMTLHVNAHSQDAVARHLQELLRLLEKGVAYWTTDWSNVTIGGQLQNAPVWIKAQANCETNPRYALIHFYDLPSLTNPYAQPFFSVSNVSAMNDLTLALERGHWLADEPGGSTCVEVSSLQPLWDIEQQWVSNTSIMTTDVTTMIALANGDVLAGETNVIWRTTDNGSSWVNEEGTVSSTIRAFIQLANGYVLAGDDSGEIWRSTDNGDNWTLITTRADGVYSFVQLVNGDVLAGEGSLAVSGKVIRSQDNGATWADLSTDPTDVPLALLLLDNGDILAGLNDGDLLKSIDSGASWIVVSTFSSTIGIPSLFQASTSTIFASGGSVGTETIFESRDSAETWQTSGIFNSIIWSIFEASNGSIYAVGETNSELVESRDDGVNWRSTTINLTTNSKSIIESLAGDFYVGGGDGVTTGRVLKREALVTTPMGRSATCNNEIFIANKQSQANLTHIKVDDGGVFSDLLPMSAFPVSLLPAVPVVNDAIYFGITTTGFDIGLFDNLVLDIASGIAPVGSYTIVWEYYNGAWVTLTVRDGTDDGIGRFRNTGVRSIHWEQPSDWSSTTIDSIVAYWVRARVSAIDTSITAPTQQNRNIYTAVLPYANIAIDQVLGDISAIAQIKAHNRSDEDGRGGSAPNLWDNRFLIALRSYDRGEDFQAYLNVSDEQNPASITVAATGANTAFAADATTPTGRRATYNPAGVEAMATQVTISLGPSIARDFYGVFHAFLRVQRTAGASTDFDVQLQIVSGSGGVSFTTPSKQIQTTTAFEVLDFGRITIPASGSLQLTDLGDTTEIRIQASAASGTPNLNMYDLILIPTDEWAIDAVDFANNSDSVIGRVDDIQRLLDIDSVTNPKIPINAIVRDVGGELVVSIYNPITNGEAILQANEQQRLWFFAMQTSATGTSYNWIAPPEIAHSIQVFHNARYLSMRGER